MGWGLGLAELGNKDELDQLGLELWSNWSLQDFPGWWGGGGGEKLGIKLKLSFSWGLGLAELGNTSIKIKNYQTLSHSLSPPPPSVHPYAENPPTLATLRLHGQGRVFLHLKRFELLHQVKNQLMRVTMLLAFHYTAMQEHSKRKTTLQKITGTAIQVNNLKRIMKK